MRKVAQEKKKAVVVSPLSSSTVDSVPTTIEIGEESFYDTGGIRRIIWENTRRKRMIKRVVVIRWMIFGETLMIKILML